MRQGDTLSATLFSLALHRAVKNIQIMGTIVNRLTHLFSCANDVVLVSGSTATVMELLPVLETVGRILGLQTNEAKTKYPRCLPRRHEEKEKH